jgi:peptidoglycan/LPS O-acetylase OafA/YrhL
VFGYSALALVFGSAIAFAVTPGRTRITAAVLGIPPLTILGQYSYAIYLFNRPVLSLVRDHLFKSIAHRSVLGSMLPVTLAFQATVIALSLAAAMVSWHLFEKRFLALKRYFAGPARTPAVVTGGQMGSPELR